MSEGKDIELDKEAQALFAQLGGTESWIETRKDLVIADRLAKSLLEEQKRFDTVRILLMQMVYLISRYLADESFTQKQTNESKVFQNLIQVLAKLGKTSGHLGSVIVRYRGTPAEPDFPEKYDYEVIIGNTAVDASLATKVARRNGGKFTKLPDQLVDAFSVMADYGVNNIFMRLPDQLPHEMDAMQLCLRILSGFRESRNKGTPILVRSEPEKMTVPLISDENLYPDANLTLLAGLNRLSLQSMETLVQKVDVWLRKQKETTAVKKYAGVYNATLELPKLSTKIRKPLVELNNVKWLITEAEQEIIPDEKVHIAQLAMAMAGATPQKVAKMIKSIYGDDYARITTALLGERLSLSSDLLYASEKVEQKTGVRKELLGNLQMRLDQVKDRVIDEIQVREDKGEARPADTQRPADLVHTNVYKMVSFYKGRSNTRKKMVGMVNRPMAFTAQDYEILAKDFRISVEDAEELVRKLKSCFNQEGRFKKNAFNEAVSVFQKYEQKIFAFLWHHMKDVIAPDDRVPFLNALQTLTARMNQPKRAFKVLLEDICSEPEALQFSDNKAVMLANLILHRPDKALADYEITPADIVMQRHDLDAEVVEYASWRLEKEKEQFFTKFSTIHKKLTEALRIGQTTEKHIPVTVILNLERELFIFLALIACDTGKSILRSSVCEYGDPAAEIYHLKESNDLMGGLLQNLRVAMHALGAAGGMNDVDLLERVKTNDENFQRIKKDPRHRAQARMITEWADEAVKYIKFRS